MIRHDAGSMSFTLRELQILHQVLHISEARIQHRIGDTEAYRLLNAISTNILSFADNGNLTRQPAANDEPQTWTVRQLARAARLSERTIRLDCHNGRLPATKHGNSWTVTADQAKTYLASRRAA